MTLNLRAGLLTNFGYPKYQVVFFMTDTLLGSRVLLDLYHPCLNTPYTSSPNHVLDTFCSFTVMVHVSNRTKSKKCLHFYPRPLLFRIVFSTFTRFLHPTIEYIYISQIFIMTENKELYDAPTLTVVEVKQEGVICASPEPYNNPYGDELSF